MRKTKPQSLRDYLDLKGHGEGVRLAARLGVTPTFIGMIASKKRTPSLAVALKLTEATGVPLKSLVR